MIWQFSMQKNKEWNEGANGFTVKTRFQFFISINDILKLICNRSQTFSDETQVIRVQLKILFATDKHCADFHRYN